MPGSNSRTVSQNQESDAYPTEPPRCPWPILNVTVKRLERATEVSDGRITSPISGGEEPRRWSRFPGLRSWLCHLVMPRPPVNTLSFLCRGFLNYNAGVINNPTSGRGETGVKKPMWLHLNESLVSERCSEQLLLSWSLLASCIAYVGTGVTCDGPRYGK